MTFDGGGGQARLVKILLVLPRKSSSGYFFFSNYSRGNYRSIVNYRSVNPY